eukprot:c30280_g1_i1 orf=183-425(-)
MEDFSNPLCNHTTRGASQWRDNRISKLGSAYPDLSTKSPRRRGLIAAPIHAGWLKSSEKEDWLCQLKHKMPEALEYMMTF